MLPVAPTTRSVGGVPAASAFAKNRDSIGVDSKLIGVRVEPSQSGVVVLDRGFERRFRRQPVFNGDKDAGELPGDPL